MKKLTYFPVIALMLSSIFIVFGSSCRKSDYEVIDTDLTITDYGQ